MNRATASIVRPTLHLAPAVMAGAWAAIATSKILAPHRAHATVLYATELSTRQAFIVLGVILLLELLPLAAALAFGPGRPLGATLLGVAAIPFLAKFLGVGDSCGCMGDLDTLDTEEARLAFGALSFGVGLLALRSDGRRLG